MDDRSSFVQTNRVQCYDCPSVGKVGKDDADGVPIAWCYAKGCVVAAERGCDRHPMFYARRKEAAR